MKMILHVLFVYFEVISLCCKSCCLLWCCWFGCQLAC